MVMIHFGSPLLAQANKAWLVLVALATMPRGNFFEAAAGLPSAERTRRTRSVRSGEFRTLAHGEFRAR